MQTVNLKSVGLIALVIFAFGVIFGRYVVPSCADPVAATTSTRTEEVKRDTVKVPTPEPVVRKVERKEIARLPLKKKKAPLTIKKEQGDTNGPATVINVLKDSADVEVPIISKVYKTDKYRAVVSGFRAKLDSIEIYQETRTITIKETQQLKPRRKWLALTVGPSVGYGLGGQIVPSVSATLGVIILSK